MTMLLFLVACLSFVLLSPSFLKPHPSSKGESRSGIWSFPCILFDALYRFLLFSSRKRKVLLRKLRLVKSSRVANRVVSPRLESFNEVEGGESDEITLLDLPDLALDCILEKLSPAELCVMAKVGTSLRQKCTSNHFWETHFTEKWGEVIGGAALRQWQSQISSRKAHKFLQERNKFRLFSGPFSGFFGYRSEVKKRESDTKSCSSENSLISLYTALETGNFWFPAQVFNREVHNGYVGFALSCYDAQLNYDSTTDSFIARYPSHGRSLLEVDIEWNRIRATTVDTPPNVLHQSDCLDELKPDDHIEIQWRRNKQFPYGWWYGVVGHLDSCIGNKFSCQCHWSDTVILDFKQYALGSHWRKTQISRKNHTQVGNQGDGFYGGIRKICKKEDVSKWESFWPKCKLVE